MSLAEAMRECGLIRPRDRELPAEKKTPDDAELLNATELEVALRWGNAGRVDGNDTESDVAVQWDGAGRVDDNERPTGATLLDAAMPPDHPPRSNGSTEPVQPDAALRPDDVLLLEDTARLDGAARLSGAVPADGSSIEAAARSSGAVPVGDDSSFDGAARSSGVMPVGDDSLLEGAVRSNDAVSLNGSPFEGPARSNDAVSLGYTGLLDEMGWPDEVSRDDRELVAAGGVFCADQAPPFGPVEAPDCAVHVDDPGELIAAVPAMIGFTPERSLVVLVLRASVDLGDRAIVDAVLRFDLDQEDGRRRLRAGTVARCVAQVCAHDDVAEVLAVVVDDRAVESDHRPADLGERCGTGRFEVLIDAIGRRLATQDIALAGAWAVRDIDPEQHWWTLFGENRRGALPDPAASAVALSHVLDGRRIRGTRAELTALVTADVDLQKQVAVLLDSAVSVARDRYARAVRHGDPTSYSRQALEYVLWQIANTESDVDLMAPELAEIAAALRDRSVRDAMFALAVGEHAEAAEALWATLTRALSGRDRAEAAALLGYSAYARGDGPMAGIALEAALESEPDHPLAMLLETSLTLGMRPEQLRRLARSGYHAAADLGIDLGEPII